MMDSSSIYTSCCSCETLGFKQLVLHVPPTKSPNINPVEELFSYVEYYLKEHNELLQAVSNPKPVIEAAFMSVTADDCLGWIQHSGYA